MTISQTRQGRPAPNRRLAQWRVTRLIQHSTSHQLLWYIDSFEANIENNVDTTNLLNVALENVLFMSRKISEEEMVIADQLKDMLRKTREALGGNFDQNDPQFVNLYNELKRLFDKKNLDEITQDDMRNNIGSLQKIYDQVTELNRITIC